MGAIQLSDDLAKEMVDQAFRPLCELIEMQTAQESQDAQKDALNAHIGARIKLRRKELGLSQQAVGQAIGLTFQQVQKYESGGNRISAANLHLLARRLIVPVGFFFEGMDEGASDPPLSQAEMERARRHPGVVRAALALMGGEA